MPGVARLLRIATVVVIVSALMDASLFFLYPTLIGLDAFKIVDAASLVLYLPAEMMPAVLVAVAFVRRVRLDSARWTVAALAFLNAAYYSLDNIPEQGSRFTHWTLSDTLSAPIFNLNGSPISFRLALRTLLLLSIIYAVIRYSIENSRHQSALEQEFQNARELQQVLIPETLPDIPGFTLTSAYKPALEVGGDFFQIIPLEGDAARSTLVVLGDVSGKGLKAAMAVSLIVGATRMAAEMTSSPAAILAALNRRLEGRLKGGFATCLAMRLDPDGHCTLSSAGHPAPFLNDRELAVPGALPLGLTSAATYEESSLTLHPSDRLAIFTDGLLEARSKTGELYGFDRLRTLFAANPTAAQATEAAVRFGQDDDITVLTFTLTPEVTSTADEVAIA